MRTSVKFASIGCESLEGNTSIANVEGASSSDRIRANNNRHMGVTDYRQFCLSQCACGHTNHSRQLLQIDRLDPRRAWSETICSLRIDANNFMTHFLGVPSLVVFCIWEVGSQLHSEKGRPSSARGAFVLVNVAHGFQVL